MGYITGAHGLCSAFPIVRHSTTSNHLEEENGIVSVEEGSKYDCECGRRKWIVNAKERSRIVNVEELKDIEDI